jgi:hypothetical protein
MSRMMRLGNFPAVSRREYERGRSYQALWSRWSVGENRPLRICAAIATPIIAGVDEALHFDSILASAVFGCDQVAPRVDHCDNVVIPLPIKLTWTDAAGRPLWLTTDLRPVGRAGVGVKYLHSRYPTDVAHLADRPAVLTSAGSYKDVRIPLSLQVTGEVEAWCIGQPAELRLLLNLITHIGKKGAHGNGRVLKWTISEASGIDRDWILDRRMTPLAALGSTAVPADRIVPLTGWTSPTWDARHHTMCRRPAWTP